jgi:hypothetical protein
MVAATGPIEGGAVVVDGVGFNARGEGAEVRAHAGNFRSDLRLKKVWDRDGRQDCDDGDNNKQLDECESAGN